MYKLISILWPIDKWRPSSDWKYFVEKPNNGLEYDFYDSLEKTKFKSSIPATNLLKLIEGEKEWMPTVGEMVEVSDPKITWIKRELVAIISHEYKFIVDECGVIVGYKFCRPIQKQKITVSELLKKAGLDPKEWEVVNE